MGAFVIRYRYNRTTRSFLPCRVALWDALKWQVNMWRAQA